MKRNLLRPFGYLFVFGAFIAFAACRNTVQDPNAFTETVTLKRTNSGESDYQYVPFEVPAGVKSLSVSYKYEKREGKNKIELGVFDNRFSGDPKDKKGFRGWSGDVRETIFLAEDSATHGYVPGEISPGKWFIIFGIVSLENESVDVDLKVSFNKIDENAGQQFDEENKREFSFKKEPKVERMKTGDLTWFAGDLHSHSFHSDGRWSIKGIFQSAASNNLDFISITDHNTFSHHADIKENQEAFPEIFAMRGEEVTTHGGHINVWGLPEGEWVDFRVAPGIDKSAESIAAEAGKLGALASINHPTMDCGGCNWTYGKWGKLAAVEVWNGVWDEQDEGALIEWEKLLLNGVRITAVGSSDTHQRPEEPADYPINLPLGAPTVFVAAKEKDQKSLLDGIRSGKVFVADNSRRGIMLTADETATIGDTVEAEWGKIIGFKYSLKGFDNGSKLWLIANGQIAKEFLIYSENYEGEYNIYAKQDGYVRLEIRTVDNKMLGFSNPIFFKVKQPAQPSESSSE
ncbi:MAG: CehA/McbA family metallohydrolase [Pyrinomonadaceae bacterium]